MKLCSTDQPAIFIILFMETCSSKRIFCGINLFAISICNALSQANLKSAERQRISLTQRIRKNRKSECQKRCYKQSYHNIQEAVSNILITEKKGK